jgi:hypothetical protein
MYNETTESIYTPLTSPRNPLSVPIQLPPIYEGEGGMQGVLYLLIFLAPGLPCGGATKYQKEFREIVNFGNNFNSFQSLQTFCKNQLK